jgi:hypothetical protein
VPKKTRALDQWLITQISISIYLEEMGEDMNVEKPHVSVGKLLMLDWQRCLLLNAESYAVADDRHRYQKWDAHREYWSHSRAHVGALPPFI